MTDTQPPEGKIMVDEDGDLWIACRGGRLLVSSKTLCLSSGVFRAMLGKSHFRQSTEPAAAEDGIEMLPLDDDDFESLRTICNIIHLQSDKVSPSVSLDHLYQLAILCDKYDLRQALGLWPKKWAAGHIPFTGSPPWDKWIRISYAFGDKDIFAQATRWLILNSELSEAGFIRTTAGIDYSEGIPDTIMSKILYQTVLLLLRIRRHDPI